jgi:hypothetical protein
VPSRACTSKFHMGSMHAFLSVLKQTCAHAGLLIVCVGKGTKSSEHFMAQTKLYTGIMKLGEATPTYDAEMAPSMTKPWQHLTDNELQQAANCFHGDIQQVQLLHIYTRFDVRFLGMIQFSCRWGHRHLQ